MQELVIPPAAIEDPNSVELVRLWAAAGQQHVTLNIGCYQEKGYDEAYSWGIICADFVMHVANALSQRYGLDYAETIEKIRNGLNNELDEPSTEIEGE